MANFRGPGGSYWATTIIDQPSGLRPVTVTFLPLSADAPGITLMLTNSAQGWTSLTKMTGRRFALSPFARYNLPNGNDFLLVMPIDGPSLAAG